jgi:TRAP transporter 4TM/12TM fusion protein
VIGAHSRVVQIAMTESQMIAPGPSWARFFDFVRSALAILLVAASIAWAADVYRMFGLVLFMEQFVAGILAIAFLLVFLAMPARKGASQEVPPLYDILMGLAGFSAAGYIAVRFVDLGTLMFFAPLDGLLAAVVVIVLSLEGVRRTVGWPLVIVVLVFIAYGLWGHVIPGTLRARPTEAQQLAYYLAFDQNAILGTPIMVASTIVIAFVLFGNLLTATGGSQFFTDISLASMGRYRGGSAKIAVVGSSLFGTISGSAVANVVATGVVTIPLMKRSGYPPHQAAAIESVASTGGSLMPPVMGAAAFLMAEFLQITYAEVMMVALVPAILYYAVLFMVVDLEAARAGITRVEEALIPRTLSVLRDGWYFPIPFGVLIYTLFSLNLRPEESALYSSLALVLCAVLFGYKGRRPGFWQLVDAVRQTGIAVLDILMICCAAGIVIGILAVSGLAFGLTLALVTIAAKSLLLLLVLSAIISIVLGMGMPTVAVYVLLAALVAPAMVEAGVVPVGAHLFVLYFGMMSFITPPVAVAAFAAASIAKSDPFRTGFTAMRFGWIAYIIPFLFVYSPELILIGNPGMIAFDIATALVAVWLISAGFVGYALRPIGAGERAAFIAAGTLLLIPLSLLSFSIYLNVAGMILAAIVIGRELLERGRARHAAAGTGPGRG